MFVIRKLSARSSRGQALAELALILPILLLLLVMAMDFGRVFFSWVGVQNAARIGANYAAEHPNDDWSDPTSSDYIAYEAEVRADATGINCDLPTTLPPPTFPSGNAPGADAVVALTCLFDPITPLADAIVGETLEIGAISTFPIRAGIVGGPGGGGGGGGGNPLCRLVPDLTDMTVADAREAWSFAGFSGSFDPPTTAGDDDQLVTAQITNPVSLAGDCITFQATIGVTSVDPPVCGGGQAVVPNLVNLSVADARTRWDTNGFDPVNFTPGAGSDGQLVTDQTVTPDTAPGVCADTTVAIEVDFEDPQAPSPCQVPDFVGQAKAAAQGIWDAAEFQTAVQFNGGGPNWNVAAQSITHSTWADCATTVITVFKNANQAP